MNRLSSSGPAFRGAAQRLVCLFLLLVSLGVAGERARVTVISTTDLHGRIFPVDYFTNKPDQLGLAKLATMIRQIRKDNPESLLVDVGDCIQGSPLAYLYNRKHLEAPNPMMLAMNELKYDSMTVGNHEFNFGLPVLEKARGEAKFPWLSANTVKVGTDEPAFVPYIVKEVSGVRVGVLGLTTPGIPYWENPGNYAGLEFKDPVQAAERWVAVLRGKEKVDLVVVAMHMGLEENLGSNRRFPNPIPNENAAIAVAREVKGIDVILLGHTHTDIPALVINGVLISQPDRWGYRLGRVDVTFERNGAGAWVLTSKASTTIPVTEKIALDPEVEKLTRPYDIETQRWLATAIGHSDKPLSAANARLEDSAILDLIQRVQLEAGRADVSLAACFDTRAQVPQGEVSVRNIYSLYLYENTLVVLEVTGSQLKDALEHSARYFVPYVQGRKPAELIDPQIPGYSFDMAEGVSYEIDLARPQGDRIRNLRFKGEPLAPDRKLRLATNNYRQNGGGGYTMLKNAPVLQRSSEEIRDLIIDWVEKHREIPSEPTNNWRILPLP